MTRVLSIVGAGRLGRTLGKRLREQGWRIGAVVTRSTKTSRAAVRAIGGGTAQAGINASLSQERSPTSFSWRRPTMRLPVSQSR